MINLRAYRRTVLGSHSWGPFHELRWVPLIVQGRLQVDGHLLNFTFGFQGIRNAVTPVRITNPKLDDHDKVREPIH